MQLKLDVPWSFAHDDGERWQSGLGRRKRGREVAIPRPGASRLLVVHVPTGDTELAAILDAERHHGTGTQLFLPIEVGRDIGSYGIDFEAGWIL